MARKRKSKSPLVAVVLGIIFVIALFYLYLLITA